jgi:hypothetical protein
LLLIQWKIQLCCRKTDIKYLESYITVSILNPAIMGKKPNLAIALSLIGGVLLLIWGFWLTRLLWWRGMSGMPGVIGTSLGGRIGFTFSMAILEVISGILIILATIMLSKDPLKHSKYGALILFLSLLSLFWSPLGLGSIVGAVGGVLAITWKP